MEKEQVCYLKKRAAESLLLVGDSEKKQNPKKLHPVSVEEICTEGFDTNVDKTVLWFMILCIGRLS
jgi:hypothetical protein